MTTVELRRQAKLSIDQLSGRRLRVVAGFLAYLRGSARDDATRELLEIPGFLESFARGAKDARAGRVRAWHKVRRDV